MTGEKKNPPVTEVRRLLIIGAPGGGKTTLAKSLSVMTAVPWFELDTVIYKNGTEIKRPFADRMNLLHEIAVKPLWIVEGNYLWWAEELYREADLIVWLDLPWHIATWRVIVRHFKASLKGENRHPGLINLCRFLWRYRTYYFSKQPDSPSSIEDDRAGNRAATAELLQPYAHKLMHCRNPKAVQNFALTLIGKSLRA